jgi:hypothetical protein
MKVVIRFFRLAAALAVFATTGCATSVAHWIVQTRDHQGDSLSTRAQNRPEG